MNLIGKLDFIDSVTDFGTSPELAGAQDVVTTTVNGVQFVYVAGSNDSGIQVLRLAADGTLTPVSSIVMSQVFALDVVVVGSERFLAAASTNFLQMFRIDDDGVGTDGHLVPLDAYENFPAAGEPTAGSGVLQNIGDLTQVSVGAGRFVIATGYSSNSIAVFRVGDNGVLTRTDAETDDTDPDFRLSNAYGVATHAVGAATYVFVGSDAEDAVSSYRLAADGQLGFVSSAAGVLSPAEMVAARFNGQDYLFVSDVQAQKLVVYRIAADGALSLVSQTPQYINGDFNAIRGLDVVDVAGVQFLVAAAPTQDTLLLLSLDDTETLKIVQTFTDVAELNGAWGVSVQQMGEREFLLVAATSGNRVSVLEIGAQDDPVLGTQTADRMVGHIGDDDLIGLGGSDLIEAGAGDDVLSGRAGNDTLRGDTGEDILAGGLGNDLLAGGAGGDILIGGQGRDTLDYSASARGVTVNLATYAAAGGDAAGDLFKAVENITGSRAADVLTGDRAGNVLSGLGGSDRLTGAAGADSLNGGRGNDTLSGGNQNDTLNGSIGQDSLLGDDGDDSLIGGAQDDVLDGGAGNDSLGGDAGADLITGGTGDDELSGGADADTFRFLAGFGDDRITDFAVVEDRIDVAAIAELVDFASVRAAAITVAGNTIISLEEGAASLILTGVTEAQLTADNFIF